VRARERGCECVCERDREAAERACQKLQRSMCVCVRERVCGGLSACEAGSEKLLRHRVEGFKGLCKRESECVCLSVCACGWKWELEKPMNAF